MVGRIRDKDGRVVSDRGPGRRWRGCRASILPVSFRLTPEEAMHP